MKKVPKCSFAPPSPSIIRLKRVLSAHAFAENTLLDVSIKLVVSQVVCNQPFWQVDRFAFFFVVVKLKVIPPAKNAALRANSAKQFAPRKPSLLMQKSAQTVLVKQLGMTSIWPSAFTVDSVKKLVPWTLLLKVQTLSLLLKLTKSLSTIRRSFWPTVTGKSFLELRFLFPSTDSKGFLFFFLWMFLKHNP